MADWACGAARDMAIVEREEWDGAAAMEAMWAAYMEGDEPDPERLRKGFLAHDREHADQKGGYKLPIADMVEGEMMAVSSGLRAAASRLPQTDIPDSVKEKARDVLDAYFARMDEGEGAEERAATAGDTGAHLARVRPLENGDELLALVRDGHALDPQILEERPPFFWMAEISSNRLDAYYTRMHASTLRNFAEDATAGVAFQNSHDCWSLPFGRSLLGKFIGGGGNGVARTEATFYTLRGLNLNGVATDDLIDGMRAGIVKDVSVAFYGGKFICDICGRDLLRDWDCPHFPGLEYAVEKEGSEPVLATATIYDARLAETSSVYDGATPGAMILKASRMAESGRLRPEQISLLSMRYRTRLPGAGRAWAGMGTRKEADMPEIEKRASPDPAAAATPPEAPAPEVIETTPAAAGQEAPQTTETVEMPDTEALAAQVAALTAELEALRPLAADVERLRLLAAEVERLRPLADVGRQYRADLIEQALAEGVRAHGNDFALEVYRGLLAGAALEVIKRMRDDWATVAGKTWEGGRKTQDRPAPTEAASFTTPDRAYQA